MINVYALTSGDSSLPECGGVDGALLEFSMHRSLAAVVSHHSTAPAPSREAALAHASVCDALLDRAEAVLPVRFGAFYDGTGQLGVDLEERYDALMSALVHVRGRVEVGVRVQWGDTERADAAEEPVTSGRAYLMARVELERRRRQLAARAERLAGDLHATLNAVAVDSRREILATDALVLSGAYLVDRRDVGSLVDAARSVGREHPDLDLLCTGPWPPYHFADKEMANG